MSAHYDALKAAALALYDDHALRMGLQWRASDNLSADSLDVVLKAWGPRAAIVIRAYLAHRRASDGAGLYVLPRYVGGVGEDEVVCAYNRGWNDALAAVRASGEARDE